ncbi:putative GDP-mannose-dependent alpha-(1-6)-phosphatidylinositol monomannoside mannosyltransferase [Candidatus Sulfobium mesophilum]|uniref:Putative GDP-mannose-dependent alpha-(1-6)-phosphatidylinositol monomannoside mannosyltransferase n=1 Tax=Candidatus Sulfobium mesophilum TaxID=2016548 RepID=A0A2U3QDN3_9BACT|nr:putative GDP-mannose-dependent alpha-(1-6)-phosphatidylinositol monomannoside mannosyltransferase [Candidatus Sulfobium mesophilum]
MKMLFLTERFPPSEGGSRVYYYNLCANYRDGEVVVLTKHVDGCAEFDRHAPFKILRRGKPILNWKIKQLPKLLPQFAWTVAVMLKERVDVVHCGDFFPGGIIGLLVKKLLRKPYVYYVHGEGYSWFNQFRFQPKIRRMILRNADRIVAACSYAEEGVRRDLNGYHDRIVRINPGVDYGRFDPGWKDEALLKELGLENKKVILTVGRLVDRKGQDTVIKSMPRILAEVPDAIYVIGGRGLHEEKLRSLAAEMKVEHAVKFLGFMPNDRLPALYSICDLFVMVNRDTTEQGPEGFGMVFTEASAAGKPVIGGKSGGNIDSIVDGFTGYRVDPLDTGEIASKITTVLRDDVLRRNLGRNGREWVVQNFNWREKAQQIETLNRDILNTAGRVRHAMGGD